MDYKIVYLGDVSLNQSWGITTVFTVDAFSKIGVNIGLRPFFINEKQTYPQSILDAIKNSTIDDKTILIRLGLPRDIKDILHLPNKKFGIASWDSDKIEQEAVEYCNQVNGWFAQSKAIEYTLHNSGITIPIHLGGCGFSPEVYNVKPEKKLDNIFRFLFVAVAQGRKGIHELIDCFKELFLNNTNAKLIIKSNDWGNLKDYDIHKYDNIKPIYKDYAFNDLCTLYNNCDVFVLPTHGDAFAMPAIEAMACGAACIVTSDTGPATYVTEETGYRIKSTPFVCGYLPGNQRKPDKEHLKELMWHAFTHQDEVKQKGIKAHNFAHKNYTWE